MIVSYSVENEHLKVYEREVLEEELVKILKKHLGADKLYIQRAEDIDLLKGVGTNQNFVRLI